MKHSVPHDLDPELAKKATVAALESYKKRFSEYNPTLNWPSDAKAEIGFKVKGVSLKGNLEVGTKAIDMDLDVPFLLRPFRGKALSVIEEEIKKWIAKAKAGELDG